MNRRSLRVAHLIRSILAAALREKLNDPRLDVMISITRVEISPDFSTAHVHVSVMASEARRKLAVQALQHAAGRLRSLVAQEIDLRTAPHLLFHLDDSLRRGFETIQTLDRLREEFEPREADLAEGASAEDIAAEHDTAREPAPDSQPGRMQDS